jgi:hypothetical protein
MDEITTIMRAEGINRIALLPPHLGNTFMVALNCGGHDGHGDTFEAALADALERNADWLHMRRIEA